MTTDVDPAVIAAADLRDAVLDAGLLRTTAVDGVYHVSGTFESIVRGIEHVVSDAAVSDAAAVDAAGGGYEPLVHFPPIMPREIIVKSDYVRSFPDLIGSINTFDGSDRDHAELVRLADEDEDWSSELTPSEVVLCSAACHSLYPSLSGALPPGGRRAEVQGYCFRHEPSTDPVRMQSFRMRELVRVGTPEQALAHRDGWLDRGLGVLRGLGLPVEAVVANDPFFGRMGRMLAANQRETTLKYELVCPVTSDDRPTAIASANYHLDHFGVPFGITTADGAVAHSACVGFGLERITLALLRTHGLDPAGWPEPVTSLLWP